MPRVVCLTLILLLCVGAFGQPKPPFFRSQVSTKRRVEAVHRLEKLLDKLGLKDPKARKAATLLRKDAAIVEPLGDDAQGNSAVGFLLVPPDKKHLIALMPLFNEDAAASSEIKEFLSARPVAYAGREPETRIIYIRADLLSDKKAPAAIAGAILSMLK